MRKSNQIAARTHGANRPLSPREQTIRALSDRLVEAQRPIRILDAVNWDDDVERTFFGRQARELPEVTREYYGRRPLSFDPAAKLQQLRDLEDDLHRQLGSDAAGLIMTRMCREYQQAVRMIVGRGSSEFVDISYRLYGRSSERPAPDGPTLADLATALPSVPESSDAREEQTLDGREAVEVLSWRLRRYFQHEAEVRVRLSDDIVADAAAGCDYLKLRRDARFTLRELRLLEVHEGWVHLGTTLNGQSQPVCTFLSKGSPSSTLTQEGLAVLTELLARASFPARVRRLALRVRGVAMAEAGANFLEVYRGGLAEGLEPRESYQLAARVFRGSLPEGRGPFTKDLCYSKGFLVVADLVRRGLGEDLARLIPLLFCGKTALPDLPLLGGLADEGVIESPRFVPPPFADQAGLSALPRLQDIDHVRFPSGVPILSDLGAR